MIALPTAPGEPKVKVYESTGGAVVHYAIESGPTVRIGLSNVLACLGRDCRLRPASCEHVEYVRPLHREWEEAKRAVGA